MARILGIDNDPLALASIDLQLEDTGHQFETISDGFSAIKLIEENPTRFDVCLVDFHMPNFSGEKVAKRIKQINPNIFIVMVSGDDSSLVTEAAFDSGVDHFVKKEKNVQAVIDRILGCIDEKLSKENEFLPSLEVAAKAQNRIKEVLGMTGQSDPMLGVAELVTKYARSEGIVLVKGENGVGKEGVARAIHKNSKRAKGPLVTVDATAIPNTLFESELFGHKKGSFTDAKSDKIGLFEQADGGTLFIDEIGELPLELQPKLLRAIQEGEIRPVGAKDTRKIDARIVLATNRELHREVKMGNFRQDLFYRINVLTIEVPTLRERPEDLEPLVTHFIQKFSKENNGEVKPVSKKAMAKLKAHRWPGNVRELEGVIHKAYLCSNEVISMENISFLTESNDELSKQFDSLALKMADLDWNSLNDRFENLKKQVIRREWNRNEGNKRLVAEAMCMKYTTCVDYLNKLLNEGYLYNFREGGHKNG